MSTHHGHSSRYGLVTRPQGWAATWEELHAVADPRYHQPSIRMITVVMNHHLPLGTTKDLWLLLTIVIGGWPSYIYSPLSFNQWLSVTIILSHSGNHEPPMSLLVSRIPMTSSLVSQRRFFSSSNSCSSGWCRREMRRVILLIMVKVMVNWEWINRDD